MADAWPPRPTANHRKSKRRLRKIPKVPLIAAVLGFLGNANAEAADQKLAAVALVGKVERPTTLRRTVRRQLRRRGWPLLPLDQEIRDLAAPSPTPSGPDLARARRDLEMAEQDLALLRVDDAIKAASAAEHYLDPHLGLPKTRSLDLRQLKVTIGIAHARRDLDWERRTIRLLVARHGQKARARDWSPEVAQQIEDMLNESKIDVRVNTIPASMIYIDGLLACRKTPCTRSLRPGAHALATRLRGYIRAHHIVRPTLSTEVHIELQRNLGPRLQKLDNLEAIDGRLLKALRRWASKVDVQRIVFVEAESPKVVRLRQWPIKGKLSGIIETPSKSLSTKTIKRLEIAGQTGAHTPPNGPLKSWFASKYN